MKSVIQEALDFATRRAREAEAFYKEWAQRAEESSLQVLLSELGAAKHGQWQMLAHIEPRDVLGRSRGSDAGPATADWFIQIKLAGRASLRDALAVALEREEASRKLYEQFALLGGEAAALFRAFSREAENHAARLRALLEPRPTSG